MSSRGGMAPVHYFHSGGVGSRGIKRAQATPFKGSEWLRGCGSILAGPPRYYRGLSFACRAVGGTIFGNQFQSQSFVGTGSNALAISVHDPRGTEIFDTETGVQNLPFSSPATDTETSGARKRPHRSDHGRGTVRRVEPDGMARTGWAPTSSPDLSGHWKFTGPGRIPVLPSEAVGWSLHGRE